MSDEPIKSSKRVLDPIDRISELLFGLIMVLTFTGSFSVAGTGHDDVRTMLISAFGCSEGEYLFDTNNASDNFLYTWSELSWSPKDCFRFGLVVERTKLYEERF